MTAKSDIDALTSDPLPHWNLVLVMLLEALSMHYTQAPMRELHSDQRSVVLLPPVTLNLEVTLTLLAKTHRGHGRTFNKVTLIVRMPTESVITVAIESDQRCVKAAKLFLQTSPFSSQQRKFGERDNDVALASAV
jgi:hypothetical protein